MIRAVLDTNTLISAIFWTGAPATVYDAAIKRTFTTITSQSLLDELSDVLSRDKFAEALAAKTMTPLTLATSYRELSDFVEPATIPLDVVRDPKDRIVLACAVGGKADAIVSGDKDLLVLARYGNIPILTANQFIAHFLSIGES